MGLMTTLLKLTDGKLETRGNAPGKSATATGEGMDGQTITTEVYQAPGVFGIPPDGVRAVWAPIGGSTRYGLVLAVHNYQIEIDVGGAGGMAIYSTTGAGNEVKSKITCKPDGTILIDGDSVEINGDGKRLVTYAELNSALSTFLTGLTTALTTTPIIGNGSPQPAWTGLPTSIDISASETSTVKTGG
jgi:phage gp45-like